jgi:quercetin dioxygenase-like cupin family protein
MVKRNKSHFVTREETPVERYPWGPHDWLCRPDLVDSEGLLMVRVEVPRSEGIPFHLHPGMEEVIYVLQGKAEQWVGEEVRILQAGEIAHIPADTVHATFNAGRGALKLLCVNGKPEEAGPSLVDMQEEEPWCSIRSLGSARLSEKLKVLKLARKKPAGGGREIRRTLESVRSAARKASSSGAKSPRRNRPRGGEAG